MKCDGCDNEATVHLTQVKEGKMQKMHLCADCAKSLGVQQGMGFSMSDVLQGKGVAAPLASGRSGTVCEVCGLTLSRFRKTGRMGCPQCYQAFARELEPILMSMHHSVDHAGRRPSNREKVLSFREREEALEADLAQAIAEEDFEGAADYRDQLAALREEAAEAGGSGGGV